MLFVEDAFNRTELYDFYLISPENKVLCALNSIDSTSCTLSATLNDRWELSFAVWKYMDLNDDGNFTISNGYYELEKGMEIYIKDIGYFIISEVPSVNFDGYSEQKTIKAESCECELENKDLISFYVNTGKTGSKEYLDEDNVIEDLLSGAKILKRYVALYDPDCPKLSLLDLVLENLPNWSIGHVDETYIDEDGNTKWLIPFSRQNEDTKEIEYYFVRGQFEEESINVYAFLTQKVAQAYRCVFTFDILGRKINCYHISNLGKNTGIYLSSVNYIDSLSVIPSTNDVYTQFNVSGGENLDISYVNFGENAIYNLSHSLKEPLVSKNFIEKYESFIAYRGTHWDTAKNEKNEYTLEDGTTKKMTRREYSSYLARLWGKNKKIADEIKNRVPDDGLNTDWDSFKEDELNDQLDIYIDAVNFILLEYGYTKRDENGEPIKKEDGTYETLLAGDELKAQMLKDNCWYSYTAYVDGIIPNIRIAIANIPKLDDDKIDPIDKWETQWELYGVDELKVKIASYQEIIESLVKEGYDKEYEVSDNAIDYHATYLEYKTNLENAQKALEERQNEYDSANSKVEELLKDRTALNKECDFRRNPDFGFVNEKGEYTLLGKTLLKLFIATDYEDENYLITTLDDIETYIDQAEALYAAAEKELSSQCSPQYIYQPEIENLLCNEEFSPYLNQLVLGDYLWLEYMDELEFKEQGSFEKFRLYTIEFNPRDLSEKFSISFTNMIKSQSKRDDEVFLLNTTTKTNRNSIASNTYAGVDEGINAILTPELLKAITGKLSTSTSFGNAVGNMVEYINSQPNSVLNITASQTNVKKIVGTEAQFNEFFSKYITSEYISARVVIGDIGDFKDLSADVANIKNAIIGASSTETGIIFNLSSANAKFDSAWIVNGIAGKMSINDLAAGDITVSDKMRILSENGNFVVNGNTMQFLDPDGNVGIQIGYGTGQNPSLIIRDKNGSTILTSQGITKNAIPDGLIVGNMIDSGTISKDKLDSTIIVEYNDFKNTVNEDFEDIGNKLDELGYDITINASNGQVLGKTGVSDTTLSVVLFKNGIDVTNKWSDDNFFWQRKSKDKDGDAYWSEQHSKMKSIKITRDDIYFGATFGCSFIVDEEVLATTSNLKEE